MARLSLMILAIVLASARVWADESKSAAEIIKSLEREGEASGQDVRARGVRVADQPQLPATVELSIEFESGSATISRDSDAQIAELVKALQAPSLKDVRILVAGHTDNVGSAESNRLLSKRRADSVKGALVRAGIDAARIETEGYGMRRPLVGVPTDTPAGRAKQRRVEIRRLGGRFETATQPESLSVDAWMISAGNLTRLVPGSILSSGDRYRLHFRAEPGAYVYVYQIDSTGKAQKLFPNDSFSDGRNPVEARREYTIPGAERWLELDDTVGREEIVLVASVTPLEHPREAAMRDGQGGVARGVVDSSRPALSGRSAGPLFQWSFPFEHR